MTVELSANSYGKSAVRLFKVVRRAGGLHEVCDLTVDVSLSGDFAAAHVDGDNSSVLPTDTMKNTVYAKAREHDVSGPEEFASVLCHHFLQAAPAASRASVVVRAHAWQRLEVDGRPHDHAFRRGGEEKRVARVTVDRTGAASVVAGIEDLVLLKSAHSAFVGYPKDRYTTLKETSDRILATSMTATWRYGDGPRDYRRPFGEVRQCLLETFARHESASVQHTLYAMGAAVLARCRDIEEITLVMPNRHHLLADLAPFGLDNPNEIFVPTEAPFGLIEATLRRPAR
jgi:urate oxidase